MEATYTSTRVAESTLGHIRQTRSWLFSPTHKRTEGRAPVWGSQFTSKDATLQGDPVETAATGGILFKHEQQRGYQLWASSSCTSGAE